MAINFDSFQEGTTSTIQSNDYVVRFDTAVPGGERKFTVSTLANAVSTIMTPALQSLVSQQTITLSAPTGLVAYYSLSAAPEGWIECNGAAITTSTPSYITLRNFLTAGGYKFGISGSDPKVPDLRGKFIRSNGSDGTYSSATFGTTQADAIKTHTHTYNQAGIVGGTTFASREPDQFNLSQTSVNSGNPSTGTFPETRPANIALLACIKL